MTAKQAPAILIVSDDQTVANRWRQWLGDISSHVWTDPAAMAPDDRLDVLIYHGPESHGPFHRARPHVRASDFASASIAAETPADVALDADVAPSELRMVCTLLAEIARLRQAREGESRLRQKLSQMAFIDSLTQVPNRRAWEEELIVRATACRHESLCVAIVDLDHFKQVNEAQGHVGGDAVLKESAQALRALVRSRDFVARIGGDELGLLLSPINPELAREVVDRVCQQVSERISVVAGRPVTVSAGLAVCPAGETNLAPRELADLLYATADRALFLSKQAGRSQTRQEPLAADVPSG